jgi:DNA mismatch repair ATPase MutS
VHSAAEALQLLEHGQTNRITASTSLNAHSSRSHAAVLIYVEQRALQVQQTEVPAVSATVTRSVTAVKLLLTLMRCALLVDVFCTCTLRLHIQLAKY